MASGIPVRFRGRVRRDAAAFYLSQLAKGVLSGELPIVAGEQETSLLTTEYLLLEIEVKQKKRANHVAMKLRWPRASTAGTQPAGSGRRLRSGSLVT